MMVSEYIPFGTHNNPGPEAGGLPLLPAELVTKKAPKQGVVHKRMAGKLGFLGGENIDHCGHGAGRRCLQTAQRDVGRMRFFGFPNSDYFPTTA